MKLSRSLRSGRGSGWRPCFLKFVVLKRNAAGNLLRNGLFLFGGHLPGTKLMEFFSPFLVVKNRMFSVG